MVLIPQLRKCRTLYASLLLQLKLQKMRLLIISLLLSLNIDSKGQCDKSIIGEWKVIAAFNGEIYFNLITDSTFISPETKKMRPDTASQNKMLVLAKQIYSAYTFSFEDKDVYKHYMDTAFLYSGHYCFKPSNKILQLSSKNSLGEEIFENAISKIDKGLLYISHKWNDESMLDLVLEKIK